MRTLSYMPVILMLAVAFLCFSGSNPQVVGHIALATAAISFTVTMNRRGQKWVGLVRDLAS